MPLDRSSSGIMDENPISPDPGPARALWLACEALIGARESTQDDFVLVAG